MVDKAAGDEIYLAADLLEVALSAATRAGLPKPDVLRYALHHLVTLMEGTLGPAETAKMLQMSLNAVTHNPELAHARDELPDAESASELRLDAMLRELVTGAVEATLRHGDVPESGARTAVQAVAAAVAEQTSRRDAATLLRAAAADLQARAKRKGRS